MKKKVLIVMLYIYLSLFTFNNIVYANGSQLDCTSWGDVRTDLQNVFNFAKILVPLLVIGLSTYDFIKAITQKDDKDIKKAFYKFLKRLVYAIIFFFLPVLLDFILYLLEINNSVCIG